MLKTIPLIIVVAAALTACGGSDNKKKSPSKSSAALSSSAPAASSTPASSMPASSTPASSSPVVSSVAASEAASSAPASSAAASSAPTVTLKADFESDAAGSTYGSIGWASPSVEATVVTIASVAGLPANVISTKVLRIAPLDWNSTPMFDLTLPEGKTLANYALKVDAYFPYATLGMALSEENYYKPLLFLANTAITGSAEEANTAFQSKRANTPAWDEVDKWVTLTLNVDPVKAALLTGTIQISVGLNRPAGTTAKAYYLDNIQLVELP